MSNAIKYTPAGSVEVRCLPAADQVRIEVHDTGVGIAADQLPLIFEEFYQVGVSPNSSRDGYGLGLSIVRRIVKLLELGIEVRSESGRGSVFAITLRAAGEHALQRPAPGEELRVQANTTGRSSILLVEDEAGVRNAMRMLLKVEGFEVVAAATAEEALLQLQEGTHFDLLITDFHLESGRTGTEVIAAARAAIAPDFKAILVTGDTSSAVRDLPCDTRLRIASKPINSGELLVLVRSLLAS